MIDTPSNVCPVRFLKTDAQRNFACSVERREAFDDGFDGYSLRVEGDLVDVELDQALPDSESILNRMAVLFQRQPKSLRPALHQVRVETGPCPFNSEFVAQRGDPHFRAAAVGGMGGIDFFNGTKNLEPWVFDHEFGHNVGYAVRDQQLQELEESEFSFSFDPGESGWNTPLGYGFAIRADGTSVTPYGDTCYSEDFAEFYSAYQKALQEGERAVEDFRQEHGARYRYLVEQVLSQPLHSD